MDRKRLLRNPLIWILAAVLVFFAFSVLFDDTRGYTQVDTSVAISQIQNGNVKNALIEDREQRLRLTLTNEVEGSTQIITQYPADTIAPLLQPKDVLTEPPQDDIEQQPSESLTF